MARKWSLSTRKLDYRAYRVCVYAAEETSKAKKLNGNELNDKNVRRYSYNTCSGQLIVYCSSQHVSTTSMLRTKVDRKFSVVSLEPKRIESNYINLVHARRHSHTELTEKLFSSLFGRMAKAIPWKR